MKTLVASRFLLLAACAGLGFTRPALAAQPSGQPVYVDQVSNCTYVVRVSNPVQKWAKVQVVRLSDGVVLHQAGSRKPTYGEKLNLGKLPDGKYALVVTLNDQQHRYTVDLQNSRQSSSMLSLADAAR